MLIRLQNSFWSYQYPDLTGIFNATREWRMTSLGRRGRGGVGTVNTLNNSGRCVKEAGGKTNVVRCDVMCDEQGRGEEEGQLWSKEIAKLERSNGDRGVGGWEQRGGRLVVFTTPTMWGRGSAIISDTTDNGNASPYHYLVVLLGCLFPAETPLISPSNSLNWALLVFI